MLSIFLGDMTDAIYHPPTYFDNVYEDEWITNPLSEEMIRDVDRSEVVSAHLIESPVLGPIPPKELSGGVKTLILMAFDESGRVFNYSWLTKQNMHPDNRVHVPISRKDRCDCRFWKVSAQADYFQSDR